MKRALATSAFLLLVATALGGCFGKTGVAEAGASSSPMVAPSDSIWVTRPDGGHSCDPNSAEPLEKAASELTRAKLHVLQSRKGSDGKMHAQMCGLPTGSTNAYLIPKTELPQAIALGFEKAKVSE